MTEPEQVWRIAPSHPALLDSEVHVWRAALGHPQQPVPMFARLLSPEERLAAGQFYLERDRDRYIATHGLLRVLLGNYLGTEPACLRFQSNAYGKPSLAGAFADNPLRFNVSHSGGIALLAIGRGHELGVDVEQIRDVYDVDRIAERTFSPREREALRALPDTLRQAAFFTLWTRKEAYIKARGEGLSIGLDQFDVTVVPEEPAVLLETRDPAPEAERWSLHDLLPAPGYVGALAVAGRGLQVACWQCPEYQGD